MESLPENASVEERQGYKFGVNWQSNSISCHLCRANFWLGRLRHHCRFCGQNVCSSCSPDRRRQPNTGTRTSQLTSFSVLCHRVGYPFFGNCHCNHNTQVIVNNCHSYSKETDSCIYYWPSYMQGLWRGSACHAAHREDSPLGTHHCEVVFTLIDLGLMFFTRLSALGLCSIARRWVKMRRGVSC